MVVDALNIINKQHMLRLLDKYDIFHTFVTSGGFSFSDKVKTAAVGFNKEGKYIDFIFNKKFYDKLSVYERMFVICHECLHIMFKHGSRAISDVINRELQNIAMDIIINETLVRHYGFDINKIVNVKPHFIHNTYAPEQMVEPDRNYEYYYNKLKETADGIEYVIMDSHDMLDEFSESTLEKVQESILKNVNPIKLEKIAKLAGDAHLMNKIDLQLKKLVNHKMASLVTQLTRKKYNEIIDSQWAFPDRRYSEVDFLLPQEGNTFGRTKSKIDLAFFADVSSSCRDYSEKFYNTLFSLPTHKLNCRYFVFDTQVVEIKRGDSFYEGGGTSFHIIEEAINRNYKFYPDLVYVLTDGGGDYVYPKHPDRWNVFLTPYGIKTYFQNINKFFDYEQYKGD